ncbi:MAG: sigma factor-like helix-turn-helix DNA-binding protein [Nocardioidaceae bacterium]
MHDDLVKETAQELSDGAATLFEEESAKMWRSLLLSTADPELASDAVAEAFAQLLRRGEGVRDPRAWVWKTALRIADREAARQPPPLTNEPIDYVLAEPIIDLVRALRTLSPMQRAAVVLHHIGDLPVTEVASILGSTRSAVTVHLHRGRKRLRTILEETDDDT